MDTIEGFYMDFTSEKLKGILMDKANYHKTKITEASKKIADAAQDTDIDDGDGEQLRYATSNNDINPVLQARKQHREKYNNFLFFADNIIEGVNYRLPLSALQDMGIVNKTW